MALLRDIGRRMQAAIVPVVGLCAAGFFVHHALEGDRGLPAYNRLTQAIVASKAVLAETTAERRHLEKKVALLRNQGLDLDLLDELARARLGLSRADELVILYDAQPANGPVMRTNLK